MTEEQSPDPQRTVSTGPERDDAERSSDERGLHFDRVPLLIWAGFSLVSILVRSVASRGGWSLERWDSLAQWESSGLLAVAEHGYGSGEFAMPGYALLARGLQWVTGDVLTTAVLITYVSSAAATWLLWEWMDDQGYDRTVRTWAAMAMLCFPYSFVLMGVVGPEALCLALVLGTFVLLQRRQYIAAGLCAACAMTVMVTALAIIPALVVMASSRGRPGAPRHAVASGPIGRRRPDLDAPEPAVGSVTEPPEAWADTARPGAAGAATALGLSLLGPLLVTLYVAWDSDDTWWAWRGDGALAGLRNGVLRPSAWIRLGWITEDVPATWHAHRGAQVIVLLVFALLAYWVSRRFGPAMGLLVIGVVVLALVGFADVASAARRLTAAFPVFAIVGVGLTRLPRAVAVLVVAASTVVMFVFYAMFVRSAGAPFW